MEDEIRSKLLVAAWFKARSANVIDTTQRNGGKKSW